MNHQIMKKYLIFIFFCATFITTAQSKIMFSYDTAGNQVKRELCISNCQASKKALNEIKETEVLVQDDLLKFAEGDDISYYPNPVKEQLYLTWQVENDNMVKSLEVYNLNGQILETIAHSKTGDNNQTISFNRYPTGVYMVVLNYKNGDPKTIKIIKQ